MKLSAVEWLVNELKKSKHYQHIITKVHQNSTVAIDVIDQALAMEKEQIEDAFKSGEYNSVEYFDAKNPKQECSENYYNETYNLNKNNI